jgi:hypothetical protein
MSIDLMNIFQKPKLVEVAINNVLTYRLEKIQKINKYFDYLIGPNSPIKEQIICFSKKGYLETEIDIKKMLENGITDYQYDSKEIDQLTVTISNYLFDQGFNCNVIDQTIIIYWPEPEPITSDHLVSLIIKI